MQTIGERLEEARKRKGISIREAAEATKIRGDYLQKFESNQFDINLADLYVRGFLRSYSQFLKLPADKIVNDFNALGVGNRPRPPSREVYGRMDLSVATAEDAAPQGESGGTSSPSEPASTPQRRTQGSFTRGGSSSIPAEPMINPNLVIKGAIGLVIVVVILAGVLIVKSLLGGGTTAKSTPAQPPAAAVKPYVVVALGDARVQVWHRIPPFETDNYGDQVFDIQMKRGDTRTISRPGPYYITVTPAENVAIELNGVRSLLQDPGDRHLLTGYQNLQLPP